MEALVPGDSLFFSIKDVLFNCEYELFPGFELKNTTGVVLDIGAHAGLYSLIAALYAKAVFALEPDETIYHVLSANVTRNNLTNVYPLKRALWKTDGRVAFHPHPNTQLGSIRRSSALAYSLVEAFSLGSLLDLVLLRAGCRKVDLLKLDIEGAESDVFASVDSHVFNWITRLVVEVHVEWTGVETLTSKLKQCGFSCLVLRRPFQKRAGRNIRVIDDYGIKLVMKTVNLIMDLSRYNDKNSLLLFASKYQDDFLSTIPNQLRNKVVNISERV